MKLPSFLTLTLIVAAITPAQAEPPPSPGVKGGHYCRLGANKAERKRLEALTTEFLKTVTSWRELADGYEFTVPAKFSKTGEWVDGIRRCCPTLRMEADFAPHDGAVLVRLSGQDDAKRYIREELAPFFDPK